MPAINDYEFGRIVIDGDEHSRDVILLPNRVVAGWWRRDGHALVIEDLAEVIDDLPSILIVGSGAYERMRPDPSALEDLERRGIKVEVLSTGEAVDRYRELDPASAAAALHLTC
jgi:hypothetical protein